MAIEQDELPAEMSQQRGKLFRGLSLWLKIIILLPVLLFLTAVGGALWLDSDSGHDFVRRQIVSLEQENGLKIGLKRIDGSLYNHTVLEGLTLSDPEGVFFSAEKAKLDWWPFAFLSNRLSIDALQVDEANLARLPALIDTGSDKPILPQFDIYVGALSIQKLNIAEPVAGKPIVMSIAGDADIRGGRAIAHINAVSDAGDDAQVAIDIVPDEGRFDIAADITAPQDGALPAFAGVDKGFTAKLGGKGNWDTWSGNLVAEYDGRPAAALKLMADEGQYSAQGRLNRPEFLTGLPQRLIGDELLLSMTGTFEDKVADLSGNLRGSNLLADVDGAVDLNDNRVSNMRVLVRRLDVTALVPDASAKGLTGSVLLNGKFDALRFNYQARADQFKFQNVLLYNPVAAGDGGVLGPPVILPLQLTSSAITGTGDLGDGMLKSVQADGTIIIDGSNVTSRNLAVRSNQLQGDIDLALNLDNGRYDVGAKGLVRDYNIEGFGQIDLNADVRVRPDSAGGISVLGKARAVMSRLDVGFLKDLAGGLPVVETDISLDRNNRIAFPNFRLSAPLLSFAGDGVRNVDGTFDITGRGVHKQYGPVKMKLAGEIDRPRLTLALDSPLPAAGLANVDVILEPSRSGYSVRAKGGSMLGAFDGDAELLLPQKGSPSLRIDNLNIAESKVSGQLGFVNSAATGSLNVTGSGINGLIDLAAVRGAQAADFTFSFNNAVLPLTTPVEIRVGELSGSAVLGNGSVDFSGSLNAQGVRRSGVALGRIAANANIKDGAGQVTASVAGMRGSGFEMQAAADVLPNEIVLRMNGEYRGKPIVLEEPAYFVKNGKSWKLTASRLTYSGGELLLGGEFGDSNTQFAADLDKFPLDIGNLINANLGLQGNLSGLISYQDRNGATTGEVQLQVRNFARSGLVLTSEPLDIALNAKLDPSQFGIRTILSDDGKTVGRMQALVSNLPRKGDPLTRIYAGNLDGQLRYDGPAAALWRLTALDLIDISGNLKIGADISGTLDNPIIAGAIATDDARLESASAGTVVSGIKARGSFDGSSLKILDLTGNTPMNGSLTGTGSFDFAAPEGIGIALDFDVVNALLINRDDLTAQMTGPLNIRSDGNGGAISGDVTLNSSSFKLGNADVAAELPDLKVRHINRPADEYEPEIATQPWVLNVKAKAPNRLAVSGLGLESEWSANLDISGQVISPRLVGRADLIRGEVDFAGKTFRLERGIIRFVGAEPANPIIDIAANAEVEGISATINVTGRGLSPEISFTSNPAMPQEELLSRILFGSSVTSLSAPEALQLAAAVASLQGDGSGSLDPINAVRQAAGLDRLRIVGSDEAQGTGTSISAGKYITRDTYVELITDGQGYTATQIEYRVTRWLSILSSISTLGEQSAVVRVSKDY